MAQARKIKEEEIAHKLQRKQQAATCIAQKMEAMLKREVNIIETYANQPYTNRSALIITKHTCKT